MIKKDKAAPEPIRDRPVDWRELVVLCRKCSRKMKGGFGENGRDKLRSVLRDALRAQGRRREVRIIETGCFGVCPKRGVVVVRGSEPGRLLIVPEGQPVANILDSLGLGTPKPAAGPTPNGLP